MINIKKKFSKISFCLVFSITLCIFGFFLIIDSLSNIILPKNNYINLIDTKLAPSVNIHKNFYINFSQTKNNDKNSFSNDQSTDIEIVAFKKDIPALDLQTLPNEYHLIDNIKTKKEKFIITILPYVVNKNEEIRANRKKLLKMKNMLMVYKTLNKEDQKFIKEIARKYNVNTHNKHKIDTIEILLELVDEIPNSIVLAQSANESGWGNSRFAKQFNAFFGEYTFDSENGVVPTYRDKGDKHLIKFFPSINESVNSYFKNLNTHPAYKIFREKRKFLRSNNLELDPIVLIKYLNSYAKDKNYVKNIESIIRINKLTNFDKVKSIITRS